MDKLQEFTKSDFIFFINQNIEINLQDFAISLLCT